MLGFTSEKSKKLFVVGQVRLSNMIEKEVTAYGLARWLKCSPPTARKILKSCESDGLLASEKTYRGNTIKYVWRVTLLGTEFFKENYSVYMSMLEALYSEITL